MCLLRVLSLWFIGAQGKIGKLLLEHLHSSLMKVTVQCMYLV